MTVALVCVITLFLCLFNSQETTKQVDKCKEAVYLLLVGKCKDCCLPSSCAVNAESLVHRGPFGCCLNMHLSVSP